MTRGTIHSMWQALCTFAANSVIQHPSLLKDLNSHSTVGLLGALHFRTSRHQEVIHRQGMPLTSIGDDMQNRQ